MRKTLITAALLLCVCVLVFTAATVFLMPVSEDVVVTQTVLHGDPAAAQGLNVDFRAQYKSTLQWDIHCDPVTGESDTDFIFSHNDPFYVPYDSGPRGVEMYTVMDYRSYVFYASSYFEEIEDKDGGLFKLGQYLKSLPPLLENEQDGNSTVAYAEEEVFHAVDLSDFFDYYPFQGSVDLFGAGAIPLWDPHHDYGSESPAAMLATLFNDYFKIPVQNNATFQISIYEYRSGQRDYHFVGFPEGSTFFCPEQYGFVVGNDCYFVLSDTLGHDVSQIPGGWGIYRLNCTLDKSETIVDAQLSTVYPLDPADHVIEMELSADGKTILLLHSRDKSTYLTVIDLATMVKLQEIEIYSGLESPYIYVDIHDEFVLIHCVSHESSYQRLSVYQRLPDGTYEQRIDVDPSSFGQPLIMQRYAHDYVAFDGQRLAVVDELMRDVEENGTVHGYVTCGFALQIFDSTGLLYHGEYGTSLERTAWNGPLYGDSIYANYNAPFRLEWEQ